MKISTGALALLFVAATGCGADQPQEVAINTGPLCSAGESSCLNAQTQTHDVGGIRVIHKRVKGEPVVAVRVLFEHPDRRGPQLWAESLALSMFAAGGPSDLGSTKWRRALDDLGANVVVSGGTDYATVSAVVPAPNWQRLWELLASALEHPVNADYLLENRRNVFLHGYDTELDEPSNAASVTAWSALFKGHRYDRARQTMPDLKSVTGSATGNAWTQLLIRKRMSIVVVGDVDWNDLRIELQQALDKLPGSDVAWSTGALPDASPLSGNQTAVLDYPDSPTWNIAAYFLGPNASDPDYAALALGVAVLDRRLFVDVRDARGLAYSVQATLYFYRQSMGRLWLTTNTPADALSVVQQTVAELLQNPPSQDELDAARHLLQTNTLTNNRTSTNLAHTLGDWQLTTGDRLDTDRFMHRLDDITPDQAQQALRRYLHSASIVAAGAGASLDETQLRALLPEQSPDASP